MTERIGLQAIFDTRQFDAGLNAYNRGVQTATRITASATQSINAFGQIGIGALREIGAGVARILPNVWNHLRRLSTEFIRASLDGSELERVSGRVFNSFVAITRSNLGPFFDELAGMAAKAAPGLLGVVNAAEQYLGGLAQQALGWGQGMIGAFADGILSGAVAVINTLANIAAQIAYWLSPGSPPRLLPDLDDWGTEAMNVWLEGWASADFGIFNQISGTLERLIRSTATGAGDAGLIPRLLGTREGIARAVEELRTAGAISADTMDAIIGQVGTAEGGVRAYLESLVGLEAANSAVAAAQNRLNQVTDEYNALLKPVNKQLDELDEATRRLQEDQQARMLEMILADPNATAAEKQRAQIELDRIAAERQQRELLAQKAEAVEAAQDELDAAKEQQAAAEEQFNTQRALLDLQSEQNALIASQIALLERLSAAVGGGGGGGGGRIGGAGGGGIGPIFTPDLAWLDALRERFAGPLENLKEQFAAAWAAILATMQPAVDAWNNEVVPAWNNLKDAFLNSLPEIESAIGRAVAFVVAQMGITLPGIFENVGRSLDTLARIWEKHGDTIITAIRVAFEAIFTVINVTLLLISGIIAIALRVIENTFDTAAAILSGDWEAWWNSMQSTAADIWEIIKSTVATALNAILLLVGSDLDTFIADWRGVWDNALVILSTGWELIKEAVSTALQTLSDNLAAWLQSTADMLLERASAWGEVGAALIQGIIDGISGAISGLVDAAAAAAAAALEGAKRALGIASPSKLGMQLGANFGESIAAGVMSSLGNLSLAGASIGTTLINSPALAGGGDTTYYGDTINYSPVYQGAPVAPQRDVTVMRVFSRRR